MRRSLTSVELTSLCSAALVRVGADPEAAQVLSLATVEAEQAGKAAVGVAHLFDYLDGYEAGRIATDATPVVSRPAPSVIEVHAHGGLAQVAFSRAFELVLDVTRENGTAVLWINGSFTCGELGYYPRQLAHEGFIALAAANGPAQVALGNSPGPVVGTNPLAYAVPRRSRPPLVVDQASSSTAFVNIRRAALTDEPLPAGWALDAQGQPTLRAREALEGALLPFGGYRGGNLALLVEILATLSGACFSSASASFEQGSISPGIGVFVLTLDPERFVGSLDRLDSHLESLRSQHGVRLPGLERRSVSQVVEVDDAVLRRLYAAAHGS